MDTPDRPQADRLADDLLYGAAAIARELGIDLHAVYYIHRTQKLPIGRLGKTLVASRRKLARATNSLTS
jgi:hypothetical protein